MKLSEVQWSHWSSVKANEIQCSSMEFRDVQWRSMKFSESPWRLLSGVYRYEHSQYEAWDFEPCACAPAPSMAAVRCRGTTRSGQRCSITPLSNMRDYSGRFVANPLRKGGGFCMKKLLNPFQWTQHTLDNFTSWFSLVPAEVVPGTLEPFLGNSYL